jgi:hypothetical protein
MSKENEKNEKTDKKLMKQLEEQFDSFVKGMFGDSGVKFIQDTRKQTKEFSAKGIKAFVEFGDQMVDKLKLKDNELVKKSGNSIKDLLKQMGLLEEEKEDEF